MLRTLNIARKTLTSALIKLMLQPLRVLPVKKNRVLFSSFLEKQYSCNPKYISRELKRLYGDKVEIVWAFRKPDSFAFLKEEGIETVNARSFRFIRLALTSRVVCTNTYYKPTLPRRKKQFYLRTWHGGGAYKRVGRFIDMPLIERINTAMRQSGADLYLSSSEAFTRMTLRDSFGYTGEVLEKGMPRNDLLINKPGAEIIDGIRERIGLKKGEKLCLYAPTYRKDAKVHAFQPDYGRLLKVLCDRFGGSWVMGYRSHHVTMYLDQNCISTGALNLTDYPDMQELILAADCLITDYSSSIWDMALMEKPVFLFAPDLKDYLTERDFYMDIHTWPFPLSENMTELENRVIGFDEKDYSVQVKKHLSDLGCRETGKAAYYAARRIGYEIGLEDRIYDDQ